MNIHPFQAVVPDLTKMEVTDSFFETVKEQYPQYCEENLFIPCNQKAIYLYEIETSTFRYHGVVASLDLDDYRAGKVKKHENTLVEKEKLQMKLLLERGAMVKPVLLAHQDSIALRKKIIEYTSTNPIFYKITFAKAKQTHRFWQIAEPDKILAIQDIFQKEILKCYVADGHHRLAANLHFESLEEQKEVKEDFDDVLCAFFAASELRIESFNRLLQNVNISDIDYLQKIRKVANPISQRKKEPTKKGHWATCINGEWTMWEWKPEIIEEFKQTKDVVLDVDILNEKIFTDIFGIEDVRKDKRIEYIEGGKSSSYMKKKSKDAIVFSLYPVDIQDLIKVSDNNGIMPPKSTWFEPRMRNGLLVMPT